MRCDLRDSEQIIRFLLWHSGHHHRRAASNQAATPATSSSQPPTHLAIPWRHAAILSATTLNPLLMAPLFLLLLLLLAQQSHPSAHTPVYGHLFIMPTESRSNIFIIISSCCHFGEHHRFVVLHPKKGSTFRDDYLPFAYRHHVHHHQRGRCENLSSLMWRRCVTTRRRLLRSSR